MLTRTLVVVWCACVCLSVFLFVCLSVLYVIPPADLRNNKVGDKGVLELAMALTNNIGLESLDLQKNGITTEGARALLNALPSNFHLQSLNLKGNKVRMTYCLTRRRRPPAATFRPPLSATLHSP